MRPTDFAPRLAKAASAAFADARKAIDRGKLRKALTLKNHRSIMELLDKPLRIMGERLQESVPDILAETRDEAGRQGAAALRNRLRTAGKFRVGQDAPKVEFAFDETDPAAVAWVKAHGGELINGITGDTRDQIVALLEDAFTQGVEVDALAEQIASVIGDDARAELIARTETMAASNEGQQEAWGQAVDDGLLTGNEKQEWIITPDDRLCPICEALDGQQVPLDQPFESDGDTFDGPPAHPNCRCTVGLVV